MVCNFRSNSFPLAAKLASHESIFYSKSVCLERRHVSQLEKYSQLYVGSLDKQLLILKPCRNKTDTKRHFQLSTNFTMTVAMPQESMSSWNSAKSEMSSLRIEPTIKSHGPQFSVSRPGDAVYYLAAVFKRLVFFLVLMSSTTMVLVFTRFLESRLNSPS